MVPSNKVILNTVKAMPPNSHVKVTVARESELDVVRRRMYTAARSLGWVSVTKGNEAPESTSKFTLTTQAGMTVCLYRTY